MKNFLYFILIVLTCGFVIPSQAELKTQDKVEPVIIIGGGVGALTSSIYLQRAGIDTIVIEGNIPGGAIAQSPMVHNWPGEVQIDGQALVSKIRKQAEVNGAKIVPEEVIDVDFSKRPFKITTRDLFDHDKTQIFQSKTAIIALGSTPRLLKIPGESGEKGYWTRGVYSCAVCDGALYKNKTVAVVGGGDTAIIEADYLSNIAKKVYIILRSNQFRTVETLRKEALIKKDNVEVLYNTKVQEVLGDGQKVTDIQLSTSKKLPVNALFIAIGANPNSQLFKNQLDLDEKGYIRLTKDQQTSVPGVYAIGDVVDPVYKQAISAAGDGAKAALQAEHYLASLPKTEVQLAKPQPKIVTVKNSSSGKVEEVDTSQFYEAIEDKSMPVVVDFYSPFCGPCRRLAPELDKKASQHSGKVRFIKVNIAKHTALAEKYNVYGVPTVIVFKKGKATERGTGLDEIGKILKKL